MAEFPKSVRKIEIVQQTRFGFTKELCASVVAEHKSSISDYYYILHDKENKEPHIHLLLFFFNPTPTSMILAWFGKVINMQCLERVKKDESAVAYLTHANVDKVKYEIDEVVCSNPDVLTKAVNSALALGNINEICRDIINGTISERDFFTQCNGELYVKHKRKIESAFEFRYECQRKRF